jgi:hypothetical protein
MYNRRAMAGPNIVMTSDADCLECPIYDVMINDQLPEDIAQSLSELRAGR